jgi:SAM-dependent methyltransferase
MISQFYDELTPFFHLIHGDWETSIKKQAADLDGIIRERWGDGAKNTLDVSCGIGTQTIGLAALGYTVTASDISTASIERARREARSRELTIDFSVADMRRAYDHHRREFDVVISCDNSVPHLLTDDEIFEAFEQFYRCARPGGGCVISVRDYAAMDLEGVQIRPHGVRFSQGTRYVVFQVWEFQGATYDLSIYFVEDCGGAECKTYVMRGKYYAVTTGRLIELMSRAGFENVERLDGRFFQPIIIGTRPL